MTRLLAAPPLLFRRTSTASSASPAAPFQHRLIELASAIHDQIPHRSPAVGQFRVDLFAQVSRGHAIDHGIGHR